MGPPQSSAGHAPEVAIYSQPALDGDRCTTALVASLWEELAALCQRVDSHKRSASQHDGEEAEDEDKHPAVRRCLRSSRCFVMDTLPDYIPKPVPAGHAPCFIVLASLDRLFEEEHRSCAIDVQVK